MRSVFVNYWHDSNKGDAAILAGSLALFREVAGKGVTCGLVTKTDARGHLARGAVRHTSRDVLIAYPPVAAHPRSRVQWIWQIPRGILKLGFPGLLPSNSGECLVERSGVAVLMGGLYLAFPHRTFLRLPFRLFAYVFLLLYARRLGKRVGLFGCSLGPFNNVWSRALMRWFLKRVDFVVLRESLSADLVGALGVDSSKIWVAPDPAFGLPVDRSQDVDAFLARSHLGSQQFVAFVPRRLRGYGHSLETEKHLVHGFLALAREVEAKGLKVVVVAHTLGPTRHEDDRLIVRELVELARAQSVPVLVFDGDLPPGELAYLYSLARAVVTVRFHGAVMALASGTPTIVIPYFGTKAQGLFRDLGLERYVVELQEGWEKSAGEKLGQLIAGEDSTLFKMVPAQARERLIAAVRWVLEGTTDARGVVRL